MYKMGKQIRQMDRSSVSPWVRGRTYLLLDQLTVVGACQPLPSRLMSEARLRFNSGTF